MRGFLDKSWISLRLIAVYADAAKWSGFEALERLASQIHITDGIIDPTDI